MPTVACYFAQVAIMAMAAWFGLTAFRAGSVRIGVIMVGTFVLIAFGWNCRYTMHC